MTEVFLPDRLERRAYLDQTIHDETVHAIRHVALQETVDRKVLRDMGFRRNKKDSYTEEEFYDFIKYLEEVAPGSNMQVASLVFDAMSEKPRGAHH